MYLAHISDNTGTGYQLRQSYFDRQIQRYSYRKVFDLGRDPKTYIHVLTERSVYFDGALEDAVAQLSDRDPSILLEELLWDFLPWEQRQIIKNFRRNPRLKLSPLSEQERREVDQYIHIFDRRRMYYIRYGAVDQSRIFSVNDKLYRPLLFKCRDEKEHYIRGMEKSIPPAQYKKYIYAIFNLQKDFSENFKTFMPEALNQEQMDVALLEEICRLNSDSFFWQDEINAEFLRQGLQPYLIRFFDSEFAERSFARDFVRGFQARHRKWKWPEKKRQVTDEEISTVFGKSFEHLKKLNKTELMRLFRKKAKEHHPDRGGDADTFIQLLNGYEDLKKRVK